MRIQNTVKFNVNAALPFGLKDARLNENSFLYELCIWQSIKMSCFMSFIVFFSDNRLFMNLNNKNCK